MRIDSKLVSLLVSTQFPQWKDLPIRCVAFNGWDNRSFRLGEDMIVRMPSAAKYAAQVDKEHHWLPRLAPLLPLSIPKPLAFGEPAEDYPWKWSIYRWLEGVSVASVSIPNLCEFATSLAQFLSALQRIDTSGGPLPGPHSFYRGGPLKTYDTEMRQALTILKDKIDVNAATDIWETALGAHWHGPPVWVHGDISVGNLLVKNGQLSSIIDFGMLTVGDPACDLSIAWTLFKDKSRDIFCEALPLDPETWERARAWTLWKALIVAAGLTKTDTIEAKQHEHIIEETLADQK